MALVLKDRVVESSTSTGTGAFTLSGAETGYQGFSTVGSGNTCYYTIQNKNADGSLQGEWEVGLGTYTTGTLTRTTVYESSNNNNLVLFSAGTKDVFIDLPAEKAVYLDGNNVTNTLGAVQFDTTVNNTLVPGELGWDGHSNLALGMIGGNVTAHFAEDVYYYIKASSAITKGQLIMFTGAVGASGVLTGAPATGVTSGQYIMGVAAESIANNAFGLVQGFGEVTNVNTSGFADGDILYYDSANTGGFTKTFPTSGPIVTVAAVTKGGSAGGGSIFVRVSITQRLTAGTGISITQTASGSTITNTSPSSGGTVTSVSGTGTVSGISLSGTVTNSGSLTLGGTLDLSSPPTIGNTTPNTGKFTTLEATGNSTFGTASANYHQVVGAVTTKTPIHSVLGSDTNISMAFQPKGTGAIDLAAGSSGVNISNGGTVTAITRTALGTSYTSPPTVNISAPTTAGGVQATATVPLQQISPMTIVSGGTGYTVGDTLTVSGGTWSITPTMTVATVSAGVITSITQVNYGVGTVIPSNPISVTGGTGTGATFSTTAWGIGATFTITNAGSGYIEQPTVTFSGGGGSGASAIAKIGTGTTFKSLGGTSSFNTYAGEGLRINNDGFATLTDYVEIQGGASVSGAYIGVNGSTATASLYVSGKGGGTVDFFTNGQGNARQARVSHTASAVNYVQVTGSVTTGRPVISMQGSDTNIPAGLYTKGTGNIDFRSHGGSNNQFVINSGNVAVNYLQVAGTTAGNAPILSAQGTDTNINLALTPKGTGTVQFGTYTASILTPTGYITITDSGGTTRRLLVG